MDKKAEKRRGIAPAFRGLKAAFLDTVPVLTGYLVLGIGFGVIFRSHGYGVLYAAAMSIFVYAGSMQYVAVDMIVGGASLLAAALTTLMVNARHLFYGISMVEPYQNVRHKPFLIFTLTDETYSLVSHREGVPAQESPTRYYFFVSLLNYLYWISGSVIGAAIGAVLPFSTEGIDFALTALFLTIFTEQWLSGKGHGPAVIGVLCSVLALLLLGRDDFLLLAMALILLLLWLTGKREVARYE
ncbi:MAG: branched-chain amino acid transporter AzlC [Ruminococcaceae bacterium]|nr:branched-chain amino acid transporter AzlC [Oscillospiraceae bacterium]